MQANDLIRECPVWCRGIRNGRELVNEKNVPAKYYVYARQDGDEWTITDGASRKCDKVLIRKLYLDRCDEYTSEINGVDVQDRDGIAKAPDIICLDDDEKFTDDRGNVLEIETRGARQSDGVYFKVKDVARGFGLKNLHISLIDKHTQYNENTDYKYFMCTALNGVCGKQTRVQKELFLTYEGILRVLFISRSGNTRGVIRWAVDKLFTIQMGTVEQSRLLASKVLGVSAKALREVFKQSATSLPCVYMFILGSVKDLRESMQIDPKYTDEMLIAKYGCTGDLERRTAEHIKTYGSIKGVDLTIKGVDLTIKHYSYIDPMYTMQAETDIRGFDGIDARFEYQASNELVALKPALLKMVADQYRLLSCSYQGHIKQMTQEVEAIKHMLEIEQAKHMSTIKDIEIKIKEHEIKTKENELIVQDLKHQLQMKDAIHALEIKDLAKDLAKASDDARYMAGMKEEQYKYAILVKELEIEKMKNAMLATK